MGDTEHQPAHEICGICLQSFDRGDKLTALPCAALGCPSVWHLPCIHNWLNHASSPSCPLCRKQIQMNSDTGSVSSFSTSVAFVEAGGEAGLELSRNLWGFLLQSLISPGV